MSVIDQEAHSAIREAAEDYFLRSDALARSRKIRNQNLEQLPSEQRKQWQSLISLGWPGLLVPEDLGGIHLSMQSAADFFIAAGAHAAPEPNLPVAGLAALVLRQQATPKAKELLRSMLEGQCIPAVAWQEDHGDISPTPLSCGAELTAEGVCIQGEKCMVQPGQMASGWLVPCRVEDDVILVWVARGTTGVSESVTRLADGSDASTLRFDRASVPLDAILGQGETVQTSLRRALALTQILQAAELYGGAKAVLDLTLAYFRTRVQFGKPIGSNQALQHRAVDAFIHLEVAKATLSEVLTLADSSEPLSLESLEGHASRVKARCALASAQATRSAVQMHGAIGFTDECNVSPYYKRSLVLCAWLGNVTIHQQRLATLQGLGSVERSESTIWQRDFPRQADWDAMPEADFRSMVRAFLQANYPPNLRFLSHRARWSEMEGWYKTLSRQGWVAPAWPVSHGGMGLPPARLIAWIEELEQFGAARAPDQGIVMVGPMLIQHGTVEQQQQFLPKILSGEHVWCQGYSEPNAGSDLASLRTEAVQASDALGAHFIVNGQKIWTTLAQDATCIFMLVRTDKTAKKQEGISFLLCELNTPGITIRPITTLAGEQEFCEVFFDNVRVPAENLVGRLHGGWTVAKALLGFERIFLGSPKQSQYALGQLARLAKNRHLETDPVFMQRYTALRLDVADLTAAYTAFADIVKQGKPLPASVSLLKIWASETYHRIGALLVESCNELGAVAGDQLLDGQSFNALAPLFGSTSAMIYGGTNEIQRNILARQVLDLPA